MNGMRHGVGRTTCSRGFTLVEAIALLVLVGGLVVCTLVSGCCFPALSKARDSARQLKCATQVRGIAQGMIVWAANSSSMYPLPSAIDAKDETVAAGAPRAKDHTSNILSILIQNGHISPEICVCPSEVNSSISTYNTYEYTQPRAAVKAANALWDPAFSADFTAKTGGNVSYAHLQPSGVQMPEDQVPDYTGKAPETPDPKKTKKLVWTGRMPMWSDTYNAMEAILGERSPQITAVSPALTTKTSSSNSLALHGGRSTWEGNIAYNDNHVNFETALGPVPGRGRNYTNKVGKVAQDVFHFDEPDDATASNTFLGIFTTGGEKPSAFKAIWD